MVSLALFVAFQAHAGKVWIHPDGPTAWANYAQDDYDCSKDNTDHGMREKCLKSKGYIVIKKNELDWWQKRWARDAEDSQKPTAEPAPSDREWSFSARYLAENFRGYFQDGPDGKNTSAFEMPKIDPTKDWEWGDLLRIHLEGCSQSPADGAMACGRAAEMFDPRVRNTFAVPMEEKRAAERAYHLYLWACLATSTGSEAIKYCAVVARYSRNEWGNYHKEFSAALMAEVCRDGYKPACDESAWEKALP